MEYEGEAKLINSTALYKRLLSPHMIWVLPLVLTTSGVSYRLHRLLQMKGRNIVVNFARHIGHLPLKLREFPAQALHTHTCPHGTKQ